MTKEQFNAAYKRASAWLAKNYEDEKMDEYLDANRILANLKITVDRRTVGDNVNLTYGQLERLASAFISEARNKNNPIAAKAVFMVFSDLKKTYEEDKKLVLGNYHPFLKDMPELEKDEAAEYLAKKVPGKVLREDIHKLQYKGLNLVEYLGEAYSMNDDAEFTLASDWWSPIDRYIYLEKGWKSGK